MSRQFGRRSAHQHGWVCVAGRPKVPCVVLDIWEGSAFIQVSGAEWLPAQFELELSGDNVRLICEIKHRNARGIGVRIMRPSRGAQDTPRLLNDFDAWMGRK